MKKLLFILLSMMSVSAALRAGNEIRTTDPQKLPATAREFIATHFPDTRIALIKIDREGGRTDSYDVLLENGSDLEFDRRGQWTEIDAERTTVPQSIIPLRIADYLKRNYPDRPVVKIDPGPAAGTASSFRTEPISNSTFGAIFCASTIDSSSPVAGLASADTGHRTVRELFVPLPGTTEGRSGKRSAGRKTTR